MSKLQWSRPVLTIMARSKPEESMGTDCKHPAMPSGPGHADNECRDTTACPHLCASQDNKS